LNPGLTARSPVCIMTELLRIQFLYN